MDDQTRTKSYPGLFRSQAEDAFRRDASEAAGHGWHPVSQHWNGTELLVTYAYGQPRPPTTAPSGQPSAPSARPSGTASAGGSSAVARVVLVLGGVSLAVVSVLMLLGVGPFAPARRTVPLEDIKPYVVPGFAGPGIPHVPGSMVPGIDGDGLGTREWAIAILENREYRGEMGTLDDGRERWLAHDRSGGTAEVIGPADDISEISLEVTLIDGEDETNHLRSSDLAVLLDRYAPQAYAWMRHDEFRSRLEEEGVAERWFDDVRVRIEGRGGSDRTILRYTISAAEAACAGSATACPPPSQVTYPISWATDDVIDFLRTLGFEGDAQPGGVWQGTEAGHTAWVRSSGDEVDELEVIFSMMFKGERDVVWENLTEVGHEAGLIVDTYAPEARDYFTEELARIADGSEGGSEVVDGVEVGVHGRMLDDGNGVLFLTIDPP